MHKHKLLDKNERLAPTEQLDVARNGRSSSIFVLEHVQIGASELTPRLAVRLRHIMQYTSPS